MGNLAKTFGLETKPQLWTLRLLEPEVILQSSAFWLLRSSLQKAKPKVKLKHTPFSLKENKSRDGWKEVGRRQGRSRKESFLAGIKIF